MAAIEEATRRERRRRKIETRYLGAGSSLSILVVLVCHCPNRATPVVNGAPIVLSPDR
jgi:hypothetical protein